MRSRHRPRSCRRLLGAAVLGTPLALGHGVQAASLKGYATPCSEKKEICTWHKAVVAPPKGWSEDEAWTQRYRAMVMFPNGNRSKSKPVMYVRAHAGDPKLELGEYIGVAQQRWKQRVPDTTIEPLADVVRSGKPTLKVFLYRNPSQRDQAFELTAFAKDTDAEHPESTYFFQIVLSAPSMDALEKAKAAFYDVLARL